MMTKTTFLLLSFLLVAPSSWATELRIKEVEFSETGMDNVIRTLSELSDANIIATPGAADKIITIHLKDVSILDAIKSISRISDLWYRYDDDTHTYRLMTREEYSKDLVVRESEHVEVFRLLNANVQIIAQTIEDLYGQRVVLSMGIPAGQNSQNNASGGAVRSNNSVRNVRSNRNGSFNTNSRSRSGSTISTTGLKLDGQSLSIDQVEEIAALIDQAGNRSLDAESLSAVTSQSQPIYVTVNNEHNMLIVRSDDKAILNSIRKLVAEMDIPVPQVMLEMRILNVILGEDFNSIFNFELQPSGSNQSQQPVLLGNNALLNSGSFVYEFLNNRLRANLEFLEENRRVKVLSNPMVVASNHREAELFIGQETLLTEGFQFFPAIIDNGVVVQSGYVQAIVNREDIGITLRITPRINADGTVELDIQQENSTVNQGGGVVPVTDGNGGVTNLAVDTVDTARLTGTVMAKDGLTVAVGGLIRTSKNNNERKVPILSEIPVLGRVFRSTVESEEETETVLLITPRIMNVPGDSEQIRNDGDNVFYKSHNAGYPLPAEPPNRFIDKADDVSATSEAERLNGSRQATYMEMSQYAADMVRVSEIERVRDPLYQPARVSRVSRSDLFANSSLIVKPLDAWNRGGMYVTAIEVMNLTSTQQEVDYQAINGRWLASSVEKTTLSAKGSGDDSTYMYLVSVLPFEESLNDVR